LTQKQLEAGGGGGGGGVLEDVTEGVVDTDADIAAVGIAAMTARLSIARYFFIFSFPDI
jgi:hypothetical protein